LRRGDEGVNCPSCGYDNKPDALTCNLCQAILRREKPIPVTPPPELAEPVATLAPAAWHPRPPFPAKALLFGLAFAVLGTFLSCRQYRRATFPQYPRTMSTSEMLAHSGYAYTRFNRDEVLRDQAVFRKRSDFHAIDPRVGFETSDVRELLKSRDKLMGTYVKLNNAGPFLRYFTLISKRIHYQNGQVVQEETIGHRVFAPTLFGDGAVWVVSGYSQTEPKAEPFLNAGTHAGTLVSLKVLLDNESFSKLQHAYSSGPNKVNYDSIAIVEGPAEAGKDVSAWYPLGTSHELFVEVPDDADLDYDYSEGILDEPITAAQRAALQTALDKRGGPKVTLPEKVRAIVLTKPEAFKESRRIGDRFDRFYLGLIATGAILLGVAVLRLRQMFTA
jgi:hypothetical protein